MIKKEKFLKRVIPNENFLNLDSSTTNEDILRDWAEIRNTANEILDDDTISPVRAKVPLAGNRETTNRLIY